MKRLLLFIICILPVCSRVLSQHIPTHAPVNPDFTRFIHTPHLHPAGSDTFRNGAMPPPVRYNFDEYFRKNRLKSGNLPAVYDLRPGTYLTPVKGQTNNACWAFATMASVESQWLKLGLGASDLSENNLKYCNGFDASRNEFGNHFMATAYFARRKGPLTETDDPNAANSSCPGDKIPLAYITDARYLPHDMDAVKQAIMQQGAIYTMMYFVTHPDSLYYNASSFTYYYSGSHDVNHAVDLVGWDDNKATAGGEGAWICRNSYGAGWGDNGYFYVSYNDTRILDYNAYWPARMDYEPEAQVYGYDELGNWSSTGYGGPSGFMLVKFTASRNQLISKVATYAMAAGTTIGIDIYDHFDPATDQLSGQRTHQPGLPCELPGYYTFNLDKPVTVAAGSDFYIRIYYQTAAYDYPIPVEEAYTGYSAPVIETGKAWIGYDSNGESAYWLAIGGNTDYAWDPCIKAYAEPLLSWTGTQSTDWNNASNWSPAEVPSATQNADIPATASPPLISNAMTNPASCKALIIRAGARLNLSSGTALTVHGDLTNYAGATGLVIGNGASLITLGAVNGQATLQQTISGSRWHFISPPVTGALAGTFTSQYLQQYSEATSTYSYITATGDPLIPMTGYAFWGVGPAFNAQYTGYPNTGNQFIALQRTADGNSYGWNLAGNPYPSAIDWDAATGWTRTNIGPTLYIENNGEWATYIGGSGNTEGAGINGGSRYIAPGQGFFVNVTATGQALLGTTDAVRVHSAAPLLKQGGNNGQVRLFVSGNGFTDETLIRFVSGATAGFDGNYDARKLFGLNDKSAQVYTLGGDKLAINSLPPGTGEAGLCLYARSSGIYTLAASSPGTEVVLEDSQTGMYTVLTRQTYSFALEAGDEQQRFRLYFGTQALPQAEATGIRIYAADKTLYVQPGGNPCSEISVSNMAGQCVNRITHSTGNIQIPVAQPGIYLVKIVTDRQTLVRKVWVN